MKYGKKITAFIMALVLIAGSSAAVLPAASVKAAGVVSAAVQKPSVKNFKNAVKSSLSGKINLNMPLSKDDIKNRYGITENLYKSASAEVCMIGANIDTLVIIKANNKTDKKTVKSKLAAYRKSLIKDSVQYPMNMPKIQASRVYVKGNYVFFIMLGSLDMDLEESGTDAQKLAAFRSYNQKAVDAINSFYK